MGRVGTGLGGSLVLYLEAEDINVLTSLFSMI